MEKHYRRPTTGERKIVYTGDKLSIPGVNLAEDADPLAQTRAAAAHVRDVLRRTTGREVFVQPVLIFAGWYVERRCKRPEVWVLNEGQILSYLDHEPQRLSPEDVALYADRLGRENGGTA